jgi:DNA-binding GntR family transcriptional regulator
MSGSMPSSTSDSTSTNEPRSERLVDLIRARIVSGELGLGQALSDKELAVQFNTSRTPVREALLELRAAGLIVAYPQRGTYVFDPSSSDIREICEVRGILESGALRLAASRDLENLVLRLNYCVAHMALAIDSADFVRIEAYDTEFHEAIVAI